MEPDGDRQAVLLPPLLSHPVDYLDYLVCYHVLVEHSNYQKTLMRI